MNTEIYNYEKIAKNKFTTDYYIPFNDYSNLLNNYIYKIDGEKYLINIKETGVMIYSYE